MHQPLIGLNPYYFFHDDAWWFSTKEEYSQAVWAAGGCPVTLNFAHPPVDAAEIIARIDGLILVGGPDFDSYFYAGKEPQRLNELIHPRREEFDRNLLLAARDQGKPVLAICAGMQHINIIYGGTLYEDLPSQRAGTGEHLEIDGIYTPHKIKLESKSHLRAVMGVDQVQVRSAHHQGIRQLGKGLKAVAWSPDGVIEALEDEGQPASFVAVQWHPERTPNSAASQRIFAWLVNSAARPR